jgi:peptide deformylase
MRSIVEAPSKVLREIARPVQKEEIGTPEITAIIADMKALLAQEKNGVAIAAPQVGEPLRIFVVSGHVYAIGKNEDHDPKRHLDRVFINPRIVSRSRTHSTMSEGCLSVRGKHKDRVSIWGDVERADKVKLEALDETGTPVFVGASGLLAQVFQHECDHLDGILYTDHAHNVYEEDDARE